MTVRDSAAVGRRGSHFLSLLLGLFKRGIDAGELALVLELQSNGSSGGRIKSGPALRTLPTLLSTGQIKSPARISDKQSGLSDRPKLVVHKTPKGE
jgi:hypothetical protein